MKLFSGYRKNKKVYHYLEILRKKGNPREERIDAIDSLVEMKEKSLPILIKEIKDLKSKHDWAILGIILRKMGGYAFDDVLNVSLNKDKEISRRGNWTAAGYDETALHKVILNLNHPSPIIRANMAYAIERTKKDIKHAIPQLINLLGDENENVRKRAIYTLKNQGKEVIEPLLNARKNGSKIMRRTALITLLESYPNSVSKFDLNVIKRLDKIVAKNNPPEPIEENSWIVIPKTDIEFISKTCNLQSLEIVPFMKGVKAVRCDFWYMGDEIKRPTQTRVFITPVLEDKWIVLAGGSYALYDDEESKEKLNSILNQFSKQLGEAYCFTSQTRMGWYSWTISKNGKIIRQHLGEESKIDTGKLTPPENSIVEKISEKHEEIDKRHISDWLTSIIDYYCINTFNLNEETKFSGYGYLAKTEYGIKNGVPKDALAYWNK